MRGVVLIYFDQCGNSSRNSIGDVYAELGYIELKEFIK